MNIHQECISFNVRNYSILIISSKRERKKKKRNTLNKILAFYKRHIIVMLKGRNCNNYNTKLIIFYKSRIHFSSSPVFKNEIISVNCNIHTYCDKESISRGIIMQYNLKK